MQIHLSKPGGQREGPFTLEQINEALAARKYSGSDYWAWHAGLPEWVPLYSVPGVIDAAAAGQTSEAGYEAQYLAAPAAPPAGKSASAEEAQSAPAPGSGEPPATARMQMRSGMPFSALEQIFILTTGEGAAASRSPTTAGILQQVIGEDWETIRGVVPRDAIARCGVLEETIKTGSVPSLIWRTMTAFKPVLLQQAREGVHRICVRTFRIETGDVVSVFLFYNKQKAT